MLIGLGMQLSVSGMSGTSLMCTEYISSPVDTTVMITSVDRACSTGAVVIDSAAPAAGVVIINGIWRLT